MKTLKKQRTFKLMKPAMVQLMKYIQGPLELYHITFFYNERYARRFKIRYDHNTDEFSMNTDQVVVNSELPDTVLTFNDVRNIKVICYYRFEKNAKLFQTMYEILLDELNEIPKEEAEKLMKNNSNLF